MNDSRLLEPRPRLASYGGQSAPAVPAPDGSSLCACYVQATDDTVPSTRRRPEAWHAAFAVRRSPDRRTVATTRRRRHILRGRTPSQGPVASWATTRTTGAVTKEEGSWRRSTVRPRASRLSGTSLLLAASRAASASEPCPGWPRAGSVAVPRLAASSGRMGGDRGTATACGRQPAAGRPPLYRQSP